MDAIKEGMLASAEAAEAAARIGERLFCQNALNIMKFNSQICTTRFQSEALLKLGLKPETADCYFFYCDIAKEWKRTILSSTQVFKDYPTTVIPAWSLHRLIEMADTTTYINEGREDEHELWFCMDKCYCWNNHESFYSTNLYDSLINCIEWLIKEGYFNKEYLV